MAELSVEHIDDALKTGNPHYLVGLVRATGSTPRDAGAIMLVGHEEVFGTIGGGSAEWVAIKSARAFIEGASFTPSETITLGPEIDQCCGGTIDVVYTALENSNRDEVADSLNGADETSVLIFGAGHTGMALANALGVIGMDVTIIDTRPEYATLHPDRDIQCIALPERAVRDAPSGTIFIITTHDHSLDFLITAEALARADANYVGMIGSKTKRAVLKSWMGENGYNADLVENLFCPIGGSHVKNKQPEVIAAMCAAEILQAVEIR